jgi:adenine-specific DNA-methyltransferase
VAQIDNFIAEIADPNLRSRVAASVAALRKRTHFGLQFERHLPEYVTLPGAPIRVGALVGLRSESHARPYRVEAVNGDAIQCVVDGDGEAESLTVARRDVVVVKRAGEPVFPALRPVDTVVAAADKPRHILIEGENHAVLQLLHWTNNGSFDCIYIDPPYNTGARDWKYNNDYVDRNDSFKSSKWLSMMERRLLIARSLLKPDGVLIVAIDDYEYSNLMLLLQSDRLFRGWSLETVILQNNPRGGGGSHISNTHEYAIFVIPPGTKLSAIETGIDERRDYRRRGRGDRNLRSGRKNSFYAILVDPETRRAVGVGPALEADEPYETGPTTEGYLRIYPLGRGVERVWRNSRESLEQRLAEERIHLEATANDTIVQVIKAENKTVPIRSIWSGPRYNAGEQGTNLVKALTGVEFDYPKSLYTVFDCLRAVVGERPSARILDYFGGSGTTAHATMLLNQLDGGDRQSILVTNNEIGDPQEMAFRAEGIEPADPRWDAAGICRSVTFPRCKHAILGHEPGGAPIEWIYETGRKIDEEVNPQVETLSFLDPLRLRDANARAALAPWAQITRKALSGADGFYIAPAEGNRDPVKGQAVLFDPDRLDAFCEALGEADHIDRIWLATAGNARRDRQIRDEVVAAAGTRLRAVAETRPASEGFPENVAYLRLEYLDPGAVEIGRHLGDLLPTLWLMAGGQGMLPDGVEDEPFVVPADAEFALLSDASAVADFLAAVRAHGRVRYAFIITDSSEAFQEISALLPADIPPTSRVQLYRDYLANFSINMVDG